MRVVARASTRNRWNQSDQVVVTDRAAASGPSFSLTTWVMAIGLAVFLFGYGVSSCAGGLALTVRGLALR